MFIINARKQREEFDINKIIRTCKKAGASHKLAEQIAFEVKSQIRQNDTTKKILNLTISLLEKTYPEIAARYDLKRSLMRFGPSGYIFEIFIAELLRRYGYKTKTHIFLKGTIKHEIDIIAKKDKTYMIECKYHNKMGIYTGIKEVMYVYARFLDLKIMHKDFDAPWLICNTKFSTDVLTYAKSKRMKLTSWNFPKRESLSILLTRKKLYPITILRTLDNYHVLKFLQNNIFFCSDLNRQKMIRYGVKNADAVLREAEKVLE